MASYDVVATRKRINNTREAAIFETTSATTPGGSQGVILDKFQASHYERMSVQLYNTGGSAATVKVFGSLKEAPGSVGGVDWTQVGDDISVTGNSTALKSISTTAVRHLGITAAGSGSQLTAIVYAEQL